jgi:hypothetical protein
MQDTIQSVGELLLKFVSEAPGQQILGAKLGGLLRAEYPTFSPSQFQSRNLRQFIRTYVPDIVDRGRSGPDYCYGLASSVETSQCDSERTGATAPRTAFDWKAYSNPAYPFVLAANRMTGEYQTRSQDAVPSEPWVVLPKPTSDDHLHIAREFVQTLSEPMRTTLAEILAAPLWFTKFSAAAKRSGLGSSWASFRTSRLREKFDHSLITLGIPNVAEKPVPAPLASRSYSNPSPNAPFRRLDVKSPARETALRKLVQLVVADMAISDLRELALPIGKVMDHIDEILNS